MGRRIRGVNSLALEKPKYQILASYRAVALQKVCGVGGWWVVVESDFSVKLWPRPS